MSLQSEAPAASANAGGLQKASGRSKEDYTVDEEHFGSVLPSYEHAGERVYIPDNPLSKGCEHNGRLVWGRTDSDRDYIDLVASIDSIAMIFDIPPNVYDGDSGIYDGDMIVNVLEFCDKAWWQYRRDNRDWDWESPSLCLVHQFLMSRGWDSWFFPYVVAYDFITGIGSAFGNEFHSEDHWIEDYDDLEIAVNTLRNGIKYGLGETLLARCVRIADKSGYAFHDNRKYNRFLKTLEALKDENGGKPFPIPQVRLAEQLGCTQPMVSQMVRLAIKDGYLVKRVAHSSEAKRAAVYEFQIP